MKQIAIVYMKRRYMSRYRRHVMQQVASTSCYIELEFVLPQEYFDA